MLYYDYYTIYHILKDTVLLYTIYYHTILYYLYYDYTGLRGFNLRAFALKVEWVRL